MNKEQFLNELKNSSQQELNLLMALIPSLRESESNLIDTLEKFPINKLKFVFDAWIQVKKSSHYLSKLKL